MSFDNFDFSSLAPNSKRNQIYSCLGFSMGFLLKKTFNTYDIFISNFFNNFLVSHNLLTPLRPYPTVLGGLPPKKLGVHVHPVHPQFHHPCCDSTFTLHLVAFHMENWVCAFCVFKSTVLQAQVANNAIYSRGGSFSSVKSHGVFSLFVGSSINNASFLLYSVFQQSKGVIFVSLVKGF